MRSRARFRRSLNSEALGLIEGRRHAQLHRASGCPRWKVTQLGAGLTLLLLSSLLQPLKHLTTGPGLMPQLLLLDLISQMHLLFHRKQHRAAVDQIVDRGVKAGSLPLR